MARAPNGVAAAVIVAPPPSQAGVYDEPLSTFFRNVDTRCVHGYYDTAMGGIVVLFQTQCTYNEHPSWGWDGEDQVTEGQGKLSLEWNVMILE